MENRYASRIEKVQMSSIRVVMEKVEKLRSQGKSVVSLCAGEPDFNTPEGIKKATIEALNDNQTHYSSNRGYLGLRKKVAHLLKEQTTIDYDSDTEIIMTCGCSEAINNVCQAFINKDEPANLMLIGALSRWGNQYTNQRYGHNRTLCQEETIWSPAAWGHLMAYDKVLGYGDQSIFVPKMDAIFETTNAVLNTGYYRQVIFAFTSDKTLLNRAEAYILAKQYDKGVRDLQYWCKAKVAPQIPDMESLNTFYESTVDPNTNGKPLNPKFDIESGLQTNLLKAVIHARRIETVHEGERWLDIKRFGLKITRELYGESPIVLESHDLRKAIQIPAAVVSAGMERNPR